MSLAPLDLESLIPQAGAFKQRLAAAKDAMPSRDFEWYRYDSMANLQHLNALLHGKHRDLATMIGSDPVLDFGCADGDWAFFLESLGVPVIAFDHHRTNHNGMAGVRALREHLQSSVDVRELDLDANFELPKGEFGLAMLLGILYHLKNPFYVLDAISRQARYCLLSTRVMRMLPDGETNVSQFPVAYLVGESELNQDNSNFWIFTETSLKRIAERANWRVLAFNTVGDCHASDPVHPEHDERAFCLLQSVYGMRHLNLLEGWHPPEASGWRWTERRFSVEFENASSMALELYIPPALVERFGPITLKAQVNKRPLDPQTFHAAGDAVYRRALPNDSSLLLAFELDHALPPSQSDHRELGVIIARLVLDKASDTVR